MRLQPRRQLNLHTKQNVKRCARRPSSPWLTCLHSSNKSYSSCEAMPVKRFPTCGRTWHHASSRIDVHVTVHLLKRAGRHAGTAQLEQRDGYLVTAGQTVEKTEPRNEERFETPTQFVNKTQWNEGSTHAATAPSQRYMSHTRDTSRGSKH